MPRDGYESLTVPNEVAERLDEIADENDEGRGAVLERLLEQYDEAPRGTAEPQGEAALDDVHEELRRIEELVDRLPERTADLLETRFGPGR